MTGYSLPNKAALCQKRPRGEINVKGVTDKYSAKRTEASFQFSWKLLVLIIYSLLIIHFNFGFDHFLVLFRFGLYQKFSTPPQP